MKIAYKLASSILGLCLILAFSPYASAVNPKTGATCAKLNLTSVFQNKKYTCIKSGKKLVWDKGTLVKDPLKEAAKAKADAEAKALADAKAAEEAQKTAEQAKKDAEAKAIADAKAAAEAKAAADIKAAADKISLENSTFDINHLYPRLVYERSRAEIAKKISNPKENNVSVKYFVGASVEDWRVSLAKIEIQDAINLWSDSFQPKDLNVIYYGFTDKAWANTTFRQVSGWNRDSPPVADCQPTYCGNGEATYNDDFTPRKYTFIVGLQFNNAGLWNRSTNAHEYTHWVQQTLMGGNPASYPNWLMEGGAQFYGEAVSFVKFDTDKSTRSGLHSNYWFDSIEYLQKTFNTQSLPSLFALKNDSNTVKLMEDLEDIYVPRERFGIAYLLGSYASEVLVGVYGQEKMTTFMSSFSKTRDWKNSFQEIYGMSTTEFYKKLTPYFAEMASELKNPN